MIGLMSDFRYDWSVLYQGELGLSLRIRSSDMYCPIHKITTLQHHKTASTPSQMYLLQIKILVCVAMVVGYSAVVYELKY